jgi:hypothetical protein
MPMKMTMKLLISIFLGIIAFLSSFSAIIYFFCGFRCFVEYDISTLDPLLALLFSVLVMFIPSLNKKVREGLPYLTPVTIGLSAALVIGTMLHLQLPSISEDCCEPCISDKSSKEIVFELLQLVQKEAEAVKEKEIELINKIYTKDARVLNYDSANNKSVTAREHYIQLFAYEDHSEILRHSFGYPEIQLTGDFIITKKAWQNSETATLVTGSTGKFLQRGAIAQNSYNNPPGSDIWEFERLNRCCCWKIKQFTYNYR